MIRALFARRANDADVDPKSMVSRDLLITPSASGLSGPDAMELLDETVICESDFDYSVDLALDAAGLCEWVLPAGVS